MQKIATVQAQIERFESLKSKFDDLLILAELADEEDDEHAIAECVEQIDVLDTAISRIELANLLSGPYDASNAIMAIHSGAGGTESQDWAEMLMRM